MRNFQSHNCQTYPFARYNSFLCTSHPFGKCHHTSKHGIFYVENIIDFFFRNHQRMTDSNRINVQKSKEFFVFRHFMTRDLTCHNAVMTYTLVSDSEANLKEGKIAVSTPIAQGLMGKKVGDIVEIKVPSGMMSFEIMDISI